MKGKPGLLDRVLGKASVTALLAQLEAMHAEIRSLRTEVRQMAGLRGLIESTADQARAYMERRAESAELRAVCLQRDELLKKVERLEAAAMGSTPKRPAKRRRKR